MKTRSLHVTHMHFLARAGCALATYFTVCLRERSTRNLMLRHRRKICDQGALFNKPRSMTSAQFHFSRSTRPAPIATAVTDARCEGEEGLV